MLRPHPASPFPPWIWLLFGAGVAGLAIFDLFLIRAGRKSTGARRAVIGCLVFIGCSLAFGGAVWASRGSEPGQQYLAAYLVELALSADNLFVFMIVFTRFEVDPNQQHRVLFWGILGAMVMRGLFIVAGIGIIHRFHGILFLFGGFLVYAGLKIVFSRSHDLPRPEESRAATFFRRHLGIRPSKGDRFFVRESGSWRPTTLLLVLLVIETTDLVFALDSLPAVLAITTSGFVALTSNVFAILSLRSLYMALNGVIPQIRHLKPALAIVLVFIGAKMLLSPWVSISTPVTLGVIGAILGGAVLFQRLPLQKKR